MQFTEIWIEIYRVVLNLDYPFNNFNQIPCSVLKSSRKKQKLLAADPSRGYGSIERFFAAPVAI